jgi:spore coat polysaccharide biosynthesis protein SpsF
MRRVAIIQARMSSSRLPGKVLEPIAHTPMIVFMLRRVARAALLDHIVVATSGDRTDDELAREVNRNGFKCHRGDLLDVLKRFDSAAEEAAADVIVRLTGDCPLVDPDLIDRAVSTLVSEKLDYVSNVEPSTYPNGLDVEAFTRHTLKGIHKSAQLPPDREHVTRYVRRNPHLFRTANIRSHIDLSALRWTVDHYDDLAFVRALVGALPGGDPILADRFDFLRVLDSRCQEMPANKHERSDYSSSGDSNVPPRPDSKIAKS